MTLKEMNENEEALKNFIGDRQEPYHTFPVLVSIKTANNEINQKMEVSVSFIDNSKCGELTLTNNDLDHNLYPTSFYGCWQKMTYSESDETLKISGSHQGNKDIGIYNVKIEKIE